MARTFRFTQLDVFTDTPTKGDPLAVVHDATGLSTQEMGAFTDWTNLSEATLTDFTLSPGQYHLMLTGLMAVVIVVFYFVARRFNQMAAEQREAQAAAEEGVAELS